MRVPKGCQSSTKAYMLVYTRSGCDHGNSFELKEPSNLSNLNAKLVPYVQEHNDKFNLWMDQEASLRVCNLIVFHGYYLWATYFLNFFNLKFSFYYMPSLKNFSLLFHS